MLDSDLQYFKSAVVTDDGTNGGGLSSELITSGGIQNVWPHVFRAEREAGSTKYRKLFHKVNTETVEELQSAQIVMDLPTAGGDWIVMFEATPTDTQADIVGTARKYGVAYLKYDAASGQPDIVVTVDDASLLSGNDQIFKVGDKIRPTSKVTVDAGAGNVEDLVIGSLSVSGLDLTITATTNLVNSYAVADNSRVSTVYDVSDTVVATTDSATVTAAGTLDYDASTYPPVLTNKGTIDQTVTLTFLNAVDFSVSSDTVTGLPDGDINTNYSPSNPNFAGTYYFVLDYLGWSGTPQAGDQLVLVFSSASVAMWYKRVIPAAVGSLSNNKTVTAWNGESA